jgi:hypothetical protein
MNSKTQKFRDEMDKNELKITALKERNRELERKIMEVENLEIRALMRSESITLSELVSLARSKKDNNGLPAFAEKQADSMDEETEQPKARTNAYAYDDQDDDSEDEDDE